MSTYTLYEAETHLSRLIEQACAGEDIVIAKGKRPLVRLAPPDHPNHGRRFGALHGHATVTDAFFDSLPEHELQNC